MVESRTVPRQRVLKAAALEFAGSGGRISCTLRNISKNGAAIELAGMIPIPRALILVVENASRQCRVVWRKELRIGVTFE